MPANRAILTDIEQFGLSTSQPVTSVSKDGRLKRAGDVVAPEPAPVAEVVVPTVPVTVSVETPSGPVQLDVVLETQTAPETPAFSDEVETSVEVPQAQDKPRRGRKGGHSSDAG